MNLRQLLLVYPLLLCQGFWFTIGIRGNPKFFLFLFRGEDKEEEDVGLEE